MAGLEEVWASVHNTECYNTLQSSFLLLHILLKTGWLCDLWLQKSGAANFVLFFLEHLVYRGMS